MPLNNSIKLCLIFIFSVSIAYAKELPPLSSECFKEASPDTIHSCGNADHPLQPTILYRLGPGKNNVVQGIALDSNKRVLYSLHVTGKPEKGVLNRFIDIDGKDTLESVDYQKPSSAIGHQGITLIPNTNWLLSSAGEAIKNKGWYISLFKYAANSDPDPLIAIKIFGSGYSKSTSSMPVVTPDSNYLLVRGRVKNTNIIRVYSLNKTNILNTQDISHASYSEWEVDNHLTDDDYFFQAVTADNKFVYLLSGRAGKGYKRVYIYTLNGKLIEKINDVTLGEKDAIESGIEAHWEPEGLTIDSKVKELYLLFAIGDKGKRIGNMYKLKLHENDINQ